MAQHCTRREFLLGGLGAGAGAVAGGCLRQTTSETPSRTGSPLDRVVIDPSTVVGRPGFYRVGKSRTGRWWLLRPDGRPFIYKGCCAVCRGWPRNQYWQTCQRLYGNDHKAFLTDAVKVLKQLDFNAFGMWCFLRSPKAGHQEYGWPFVEYFHAREIYPQATVRSRGIKHIDVFDPKWRAAYEARCAKHCPRHRDNPSLLGYFTDNEPAWAQPGTDYVWGGGADVNVQGAYPLLLQHFLALPPERAGHRAAWDWALERHGGSVERVAADWGATFTTPDELREEHERGTVIRSKAFGRDNYAFSQYYAREYFRVTGEAIRRHDPNHLILGCRHGAPPGEAILKAYDRRYVDVLSANNYRDNFYERVDEYYRPTGMPILNGEFSWVSSYFLNWAKYNAGGTFSQEEKQRVRRKGTAALERAFTHPGLVGYTWFKWYSGPNPESPAYGLVTDDGELNQFNGRLLRKIHPRLEGIACGQIEPETAQ